MKKRPYIVALGTAGLLAMTANTHAQSADALIDKLVEKGILTVKEAQQMRDEADKDFTRALSAKNGMADYVSAFKLNGDFRARYEGFYSGNATSADRNRFQYRLRFGVVASMFDNVEAGFRLNSIGDTA
ncbi:MAG: hypothetical protein K0Q55_373, partial [Verrucomicrobia bacterium]|nr:hypothetical protein [Verrucomicrobiota bacterium]